MFIAKKHYACKENSLTNSIITGGNDIYTISMNEALNLKSGSMKRPEATGG
jgi:hypothetical protein